MMRLILFAFGAIFVALTSAITYPIYKLTLKRDQKKGELFAHHYVQWGLKVFAACAGARALYKGLEYIPEDGCPVVYVSNHRSLFDVILTYPVFKGRTGALAKIELKSMPVVGWWIEAVHGVLLDRHDKKQGLMCVLKCIDNLKNGISMLVFPEGTRGHVEGELLPFHKGTFKIAIKPQVPIIPLAISGTGDIFDDHRPFFKAHRVVIEFCQPIDVSALSLEEQNNIQDIVQAIIQERITANESEVL